MPRETWTAPAALPLLSTSGASRTSTTRVLPLAIISRASAGVIRGTAALAASIICLTLVAMASSSAGFHDPGRGNELRSLRFAPRYHTSHGATGGRRTQRTRNDDTGSQTRSHGRIGVPATEREQA